MPRFGRVVRSHPETAVIQQPLAIAAVLLGAIVFAVTMTRRYAWAARLSTILWVIFTGAFVSNVGLIPTDAPLYVTLVDFTVPFAVCVILFTVNLSDVRKAGGPMLAATGVAILGTITGVILAGFLLEPWLSRIVDASWKLAGPYTGTYIGGSLNFFALWEGLEVGNPDLFAAANAVDNLTLFPLYTVWMVVPAWLAGRYAVRKRWIVDAGDHEEAAADSGPARLVPAEVALLAFLAVAIMAVSEWIKHAWIDSFAPEVPTILVVTTLALVAGQFPAVRRLQGAWEIGDLAFYVFFVSVGAMIDFYKAVILSPILFAYVVLIMAGHFGVTYGLGRLLGMDPGVLTIASVATKAGPPLVPAVAHTKGWNHLVLPGIVMGMAGYAVGNYFGFAVAYLMKAFLGG